MSLVFLFASLFALHYIIIVTPISTLTKICPQGIFNCLGSGSSFQVSCFLVCSSLFACPLL